VAPWSDPEVPLPDLTAPRVEVEQRPVPSVDLLQDDAEVVEAATDFGPALPCTRKGMHDLRQGGIAACTSEACTGSSRCGSGRGDDRRLRLLAARSSVPRRRGRGSTQPNLMRSSGKPGGPSAVRLLVDVVRAGARLAHQTGSGWPTRCARAVTATGYRRRSCVDVLMPKAVKVAFWRRR
jgi:hypothetical protein